MSDNFDIKDFTLGTAKIIWAKNVAGVYIPGHILMKSDGTAVDPYVPKAPGTATALYGILVGGTYNATPPTVADTQQVGIQVDANGYLKVNVASLSGANANGTALSANSAPVVVASDQAAIAIKAATGAIVGLPAALGSATMINSMPMTIASNDPASIALAKFGTGYYIPCGSGAGGTAVMLTSLQSVTGTIGDYLSGVCVFPGKTSAGAVIIYDSAGVVATWPGGGTTALLSLLPFFIPLGAVSRNGAWKVSCANDVTAVGIGKFS